MGYARKDVEKTKKIAKDARAVYHALHIQYW